MPSSLTDNLTSAGRHHLYIALFLFKVFEGVRGMPFSLKNRHVCRHVLSKYITDLFKVFEG